MNEIANAEEAQPDFDDEAQILSHAIDYMNNADERAKERLMFHLTHRYFPEGSFTPKRIALNVEKIFCP